jgi:hypothetical protein
MGWPWLQVIWLYADASLCGVRAGSLASKAAAADALTNLTVSDDMKVRTAMWMVVQGI